MKKQNRTRIAVNLTLSEEARKNGKALAEKRGIKFAQLVEMLIRDELRSAGIIPNEDGSKGSGGTAERRSRKK